MLSAFYNKGYVGNGLTIPFLIGAQRLLNKDNFFNIDDFIADCDSGGTFVTIMRCPGIREYVIGVLDIELKIYCTASLIYT